MYRLPVGTFASGSSKADIVVSQCEAYEVMKLHELPQGHTHTDTGGTEQAYEEVSEGLVSDGRGPQPAAGAGPQQETTTQQMYEEVAIH